MKQLLSFGIIILIMLSCKSNEITSIDFTIAFGSCNRQNIDNKLWDDVLNNNPNIWVWGGDIIYSDTDDMIKMANDYELLLNQKEYDSLRKTIEVHGTWDDHDYGLNDGGEEYIKKAESQKLLLDFLEVDKEDNRRNREGVYYSKLFSLAKGTINLIVLDTRYFRSALVESKNPDKRYGPIDNKNTTMLGEVQWKWLEAELINTKSDFNVIVSSVQFLSAEHGFETWGNMPHEVSKLLNIIKSSKAKGVIILSGDRHISEFSQMDLDSVSYPLIDFTSSGLTHSYSNFTEEPNKYRIGDVVSSTSFGLLKFNFGTKKVIMQMKGDENELYQEINVQY
jgi:alkaline phosphatase D